MPAPLNTPIVTIPVGATGLSAAVYIGFSELIGFLVGPDWQAADITLQASPDGVTYGEATDDAAGVVTIKAAATKYVSMRTPLKIGPWVKFRSGTSGSPVNQTTAATLQLVLRMLPKVA